MSIKAEAHDAAHETALVVALAAANVGLNRLVPRGRAHEIPANLAVATLMLALARISEGRTRESPRADNLARGVRVGLAVGVPIGTVLTAAPLIPGIARFFHDERIAGAEPAVASYELLARIPLATALCEELIFRVAVPTILLRKRTRTTAEIAAAAMFGLWHILPTVDRLHSNPGTASIHRSRAARQAAVVAATVAVTGAAGFALSKLRDASGSVAAPIIVHAAINGGAFLGGWLSARRARAQLTQA